MDSINHATAPVRLDFTLIAEMIEPGTRVLDVGCGDGALLDYLGGQKQIDGRGIELSMAGVRAAVSHGLSVIQGDADTDLKDYPDDAFDYVILSQTLQAMRAPRDVLDNMLRIGRHGIVSFPNFGHWRARAHLILQGRMPVTSTLPYQWWDTPNIHLCTIRDFLLLCEDLGLVIEVAHTLGAKNRLLGLPVTSWRANLLAEQAVLRLRRG